VVVACSNLCNLETIFLEEVNFLWEVLGHNVVVTEGTNVLSEQPRDLAWCASISPSPDLAILIKGNRVILAKGNRLHLYVAVDKLFDELWLSEADVALAAVAKHVAVAVSKGVKLAIFAQQSRVSVAND